jgi:hypothetical protein
VWHAINSRPVSKSGRLICEREAYFDFCFGSRWLSALPAADLAALL